MNGALGLLVVVATVLVMEGVAWFAHRYIMHGWGWRWHRSHHEPTVGWFELNDLYAVVFAALAVALFAVASPLWPPLLWIAIGMSIYGLLYGLVHDGLVHQRWPFRHRPRNAYLRRLVQAHRLHHAVDGRDDCVSFGFLYAAPVRDLRTRLRDMHPDGVRADRE
jgi:beta-carotene 3-hydroxylase